MEKIKNTVDIQKMDDSCYCSCYSSIYDGTNTIYVSILITNEQNPRLEIYSGGTLNETLTLKTGHNDILINKNYYIASNTVSVRYVDDGYTGDFFEFIFPAELKGNMMIKKSSDYVFEIQCKEQSGGSDTPYLLPVATTDILGGVKIGDYIKVDSEGVIYIEAIPISVIDEICV